MPPKRRRNVSTILPRLPHLLGLRSLFPFRLAARVVATNVAGSSTAPVHSDQVELLNLRLAEGQSAAAAADAADTLDAVAAAAPAQAPAPAPAIAPAPDSSESEVKRRRALGLELAECRRKYG